MNWLAELLPLFFVRWYSRRYLMRMWIDGRVMVMPRDDVYIRLEWDTEQEIEQEKAKAAHR